MQAKKLIALSLSVWLMLACSSSEDENSQIRAIKTIQIEEALGGQNRRISGVVESAQRADLSFEIPGRVEAVNVKLGTHVKAGEELARLDPKPYQLTADAAKAEHVKAQAILVDRKNDYTAKAKLYESRYVAKTVVDAAYADYQAAEQNVQSAQAKLELAERDLTNTVLKAPFEGEVASLSLDPAVNVSAGTPVMQLLGQGGLEVSLLLPESLRSHTKLGMAVSVTFPSLSTARTHGTLTEIAARAGETNAFPAKVAIETVPGIYPGLSAEVLFAYSGEGENIVYLIPAVAIAPPETAAEDGYVFIYQPETSTVKKTPIKVRGIQGNQVEIVKGLKPGDIIATAGVHFLYDGQKVKLLEEK
jgi:RND family efflux transporter MFP subunit